MLLLIILIIIIFGVFGGMWGQRTYGPTYGYAGPGIGIGTILVLLLICWMLGLFSGVGRYHF